MRQIGNGIAALLLFALLFGCGGYAHQWTDATCTAPKTCARCGETEGEALGHSWTDATCIEPKTCTRCGLTDGKALGHDWNEATCTEPGVCARCGLIGIDVLGHDWREATCTAPKTCARCGRASGEPLEHDWTGGTCTEPCVCARCGEPGTALGHVWVEASCTRPKHCARCGMFEGEALGHEIADNVCKRCGFTVFEPIKGDGNDVLEGIETGDGIYRVRIHNNGGGNFAVWAYDADGTADLLALGRGAYDGSVLLFGNAPYTFEVFSDSRWTIGIEQLDETTDAAFSGRGDAVTDRLFGAFETFRFTHSGENDFVVWLYTSGGETLLVNEPGRCQIEQTVAIPAGSGAFFAVRADGVWSIEPVTEP